MLDATLLIAVAIKSLVVAGGILITLRVTVRRSAAERSLIGHAGLLALIALPMVSLLAPGWNPLPLAAATAMPTVQVPQVTDVVAAPAMAATAAHDGSAAMWAALPLSDLAVGLYLFPLAIFLLTMMIAILRLGSLHRRANVLVNPSWQAALAKAQRRMGFKHGTALLVSDELRSPVSWGVMRPIILLNEQTVDAVAEAEPIIAHELAHVARLDWAKLLLSRTACALFWFNPLVWRLARECYQLREEAADDAVLLSDVDGADYASLLVNAARHDNKAVLIAAHGVASGKDSLKRRITRVLNADLAREPANNGWMALCLLVLIVLAAPLAAFDPSAETSRADGKSNQALTSKHSPDHRQAVAAQATADDNLGPLEQVGDSTSSDDADEVRSANAASLNPDYIAAMRAAGFPTPADDLTGARAVGVTPEFARQMRQIDPRIGLDTVMGAKAAGLDPAYFSQMRRVFPGLSLDDAIGMSAVRVSSDFARQMRSLFPRASAEQVQELAAVGATPDYVRQMRRQGLPAGNPDAAIQSRVLFGGGKAASDANKVPVGAHAALATSIANSVSASVSFATDRARDAFAAPSRAPQVPPAPPPASPDR
jgi:beta-lactamase regulating signal transducer with metallopeptidase domain